MYWRNPFRPLATAKQLVEYVVLDIEPLGPASQKHALAEVQVHCDDLCVFGVGSWAAVCWQGLWV
jgi:hypothetical protein